MHNRQVRRWPELWPWRLEVFITIRVTEKVMHPAGRRSEASKGLIISLEKILEKKERIQSNNILAKTNEQPIILYQ